MELVVSQAAADGLALASTNVAAGSVTLATQTAAVGVILPPPDIRSIVDKTAQFVARNGPEFEKRILANEKNNVKFNFLVPGDPYNAYYQQKVAAFRAEEAGVKPAVEPAKPSDAEAPGRKVAVQLPTNFKPVVLEAPDKEQYTLQLPEGITAFDLDVIKLTAQFVARNGRSFLTGLTSREHTNAQFNFLKPTHSMFTFFTSLADMYSKVLMPPKAMSERLRRDAESKAGILDRCLKRLEWERSQERARMEAEDKAEAERDAMAAIDWHDFVVVETIDFYNEEDESLPAPLTLTDVIAQLRAARVEEAAAEEAAMEVEMDEEERSMLAESAEPLPPPPSRPPPPAPEPQMKIVRNYKPPGAARPGASAGSQFVVSPITGELVAVDQMAEHMRISLIDPKWREEREAMLGKLRGSTVANDEEIARNVISLARTRPDIFGSTAEEVSIALSAEMEKKTEQYVAPSAPTRPPGPPHELGARLAPPQQMPPLQQMGWPQGMPRPGFPMQQPGMGAMPPLYPGYPPGMLPPGMGAYPMPMHAPPPGFPGAPPGFPGAPPQAGGGAEEPDAKRQRTEGALLPEEDFAEAHPDPILVQVVVPEVEGEPGLSGQTVSLEVTSVMETIGDIKARLAAAIGVAASKQKMSTGALGFLKDTSTLAAYNFGPGTTFVMGLKERGGKKAK